MTDPSWGLETAAGGSAAISTSISTADPTDIVGKRALAKILDAIIGAPFTSIAVVAMFASFHSVTVTDAVSYCNLHTHALQRCVPIGSTTVWTYEVPEIWWYVPGWIWFGLMVWLEGHFGWTPGKLAFGIRVIRSSTGLRCGFWRSLVRNLLWIVDGFLFGVVAVAIANRSPGHQRLGDRAGDTFVVPRAAFGAPPPEALTGLPASAMPGAFPSDHPIWDTARSSYIIWDSATEAWLQWNTTTATWDLI